LRDLSEELEQVHVRSMNCRDLRLEWVAALGIAMASPALMATPLVTTSTSISVQTSQSSAQTNPSGAVCSLTTVAVTVTGGSTAPTGTVTINDGVTSPVAIGSQTLSTSGTNGVASFTFALSAVTHTLTAVYSGDSTHSGSTSPAASPTISSQCGASFAVTVSSMSPSNTLTAGQQGTATITITPLPSFIDSLGNAPAFITVSCSGLPQQSSCGFTPENLEILPGQDQGVTSALVFSTQAQGTARAVPPTRLGHKSSPIAWAFLLPGMLGLGGLAWGARRRAWLRRLMLLALLGLITTLGTTACNPLYYYYNHGPPVNIPTPSGTYNVIVTGQSSNGVTAITNSTTISVTVN
jgi:hypothetical protein